GITSQIHAGASVVGASGKVHCANCCACSTVCVLLQAARESAITLIRSVFFIGYSPILFIVVCAWHSRSSRLLQSLGTIFAASPLRSLSEVSSSMPTQEYLALMPWVGMLTTVPSPTANVSS